METMKIKEIIMFRLVQDGFKRPKPFTIFINDDFRDRTMIHDTIITVLKSIKAVSVKRIIDNKVYFIDLPKDENNIVQVSQTIITTLYNKINNDEFEIWI